MDVRTHIELASFIWSICNLLRGPYKSNKYRKESLSHHAATLRLGIRR